MLSISQRQDNLNEWMDITGLVRNVFQHGQEIQNRPQEKVAANTNGVAKTLK